jgi:hypothetical protein
MIPLIRGAGITVSSTESAYRATSSLKRRVIAREMAMIPTRWRSAAVPT